MKHLLAFTAGAALVYAVIVRPMRLKLAAHRREAFQRHLDWQVRHRVGRVPARGAVAS